MATAARVDRMKTGILIVTGIIDDVAATQVGLPLGIDLAHAASSVFIFDIVHDSILILKGWNDNPFVKAPVATESLFQSDPKPARSPAEA